jgi:hypothetical protein
MTSQGQFLEEEIKHCAEEPKDFNIISALDLG